MIEHFEWLLPWGVVVGLDLASLAQTMIARPLVAATVAGAIVGDPMAGATVGIILELFAWEVLPVGASRYPDYGLGAVAAAAAAAGAPAVLGTGVGVGVGLLVAHLGGVATHLVRSENAADVGRHRDALDLGNARTVQALQLRGLGRDAIRSLAVTVIGLSIAYIIQHWAPLSLMGAYYMGIVAIGAAIAAGVSGIMRLTGRRSALRWFALGLLGGFVGVLLG